METCQSKVQSSVENIADDLIKLYAEEKRQRAMPFPLMVICRGIRNIIRL